MKQLKILGEVHSVEAVKGHLSSYFEEKIPERDVIADLQLFFFFCLFFGGREGEGSCFRLV